MAIKQLLADVKTDFIVDPSQTLPKEVLEQRLAEYGKWIREHKDLLQKAFWGYRYEKEEESA